MTTLVPGTGAFFVVPSQRVCAKIIPWRRIYDPAHWHTIPPHITLAYPFVHKEDWAEAQPAVVASLTTISPFWVTLAELSAFEAPQAVLWFRPDAGECSDE
jgi:2'-5' RNA ligase